MDLVSKAKQLQSEIQSLLRKDDIEQLGKKFDDLDATYRVLNSLLQDIKLIRKNCHAEIVSRLRKIRTEVEILESDYPTAAEIQQLQLRDHGMREIAPGVQLPVVTVASDVFIPDTPLYYVKNTDEYAVRINGSLISGRVLNISTGQSSIKCRRWIACDVAGCPNGHPTGKTESGAPRAEFTWSPGSWLYTSDALSRKNLHMRHIGGRDTLAADIPQATRAETTQRAAQTAHDLLVQLAIDR